VAQRFGPSWWAVRDQPYDDTLQAYLSLLEIERIEALDQGQQVLRGAVLTMSNEAGMRREIAAHERRLYRVPRGTTIAPDLFDRLATFPGMPGHKPLASGRPSNVKKVS